MACQSHANRRFLVSQRGVERLQGTGSLTIRHRLVELISLEGGVLQERQGLEVVGELLQQPERGRFQAGLVLPAFLQVDQDAVRLAVKRGQREASLQAFQGLFLERSSSAGLAGSESKLANIAIIDPGDSSSSVSSR